LLETAQERVVNGICLRPVGGFLQYTLKCKPVDRSAHPVAEASCEIGKCIEFSGFGGRMHTAKKWDLQLSQMLRNRLVGREHELLDNLVADVVFNKVSTRYAP